MHFCIVSTSLEPVERGLEIQEAWKVGNLEVWRLGGLGASGEAQPTTNYGNPGPIERHLRIQEAWKVGNLEVWRLGGWSLGGGAASDSLLKPGTL